MAYNFDEIKNYSECEYFVEYMGDIYCIKDDGCENCKYKGVCEFEEGEIEVSLKTPVRMCIGVDNEGTFGDGQDKAYKYGLNLDEIPDSKTSQNKLRYLSDDGYLPESRFGILKQVDEPQQEDPYIVYNAKDKKHYCIRQVCSECEKFKECKPIIIKEQKAYITVALDLRSQEPRCNTYVSREPLWVKIFENDTLRENPELFEPINILFKNHPDLQIDIHSDKTYWEWLDYMFFMDKTEAYYFYLLYADAKKHPDSNKKRKALWAQMEFFVNSYKEFKSRKAEGNGIH